MKQIGVQEAKTQLSTLLARVEGGERILITRRGKPVAVLVPSALHDSQHIHDAMDRLRMTRMRLAQRGTKVTKEEVLAWVKEGRR